MKRKDMDSLFRCFIVCCYIHIAFGAYWNDLSNDLKHFELVKPSIVFSSSRRESIHNDPHPDEIEYKIEAFNQKMHLKLWKNTQLIARNYKEIMVDREMNILSENSRVVNCYYHGYVLGDEESIVAVSTCNGMVGIIKTSSQYLHIAPSEPNLHSQNLNEYNHYIFRQSDIKGIKQDTYQMDVMKNIKRKINGTLEKNPSSRRLLSECSGGTLYVEAFVMNDYSRYLRYLESVQTDSIAVVNIADSYYAASSFAKCIRIILSGQLTFSAGMPSSIQQRPCNTPDPYEQGNIGCFLDNIIISQLGSEIDTFMMLENVSSWMYINRQQLSSIFKANVDNLHMFTNKDFASTTVGLSNSDGMCNETESCGVEQFLTEVQGYHAQIYAHELGHNFGMVHDVESSGFIMSAKSNQGSYPTTFSDNSIASLNSFISNLEKIKCLTNAPVTFPRSSICGNGIIEADERCDPGLENDECCINCKITSSCECAKSPCCFNGKFLSSETVCRQKNSVCDIEERCTGFTGLCPIDRILPMGESCNTGTETSTCFLGKCITSYEARCAAKNSLYGICTTTVDCTRLRCTDPSAIAPCKVTYSSDDTEGIPCDKSKFCYNKACSTVKEIPSNTVIDISISSLTVRSGDVLTIQWSYTGTPTTTLRIYYAFARNIHKDDIFIANVSASLRSYEWMVSASIDNYRIFIQEEKNAEVFGYSPLFAIEKKSDTEYLKWVLIAVGIFVFLLLVIALVCFLRRRRK